MDIITQRRSIRSYTEQMVDTESLKSILAAGMNAPSAGNQQPWRFLVVTDPVRLRHMAEVSPYSIMLTQAPAAILVSGHNRELRHPDFWVQDCAACVQNMLLKITELGLGGVWLGVYPVKEREQYLRNLFAIPPEDTPFAIVVVGHPGEHKEPNNRYNEDFVHWEKY